MTPFAVFKMNVRTAVRVTLESSSYCTFTWCRVKFPGSQCLGTGMTRKEHWNDIIGATCMTPFFFLDPSVKHWDDIIYCKLTFTLWSCRYPERIYDEFVVYQIVGKPKAIGIKHGKENHL